MIIILDIGETIELARQAYCEDDWYAIWLCMVISLLDSKHVIR